jgi:hypothetical protein
MKQKYDAEEIAFLKKVVECPDYPIPNHSYDWIEVDGELKARALWPGLQASGLIAQTGIYAWLPTAKAEELLQA